MQYKNSDTELREEIHKIIWFSDSPYTQYVGEVFKGSYCLKLAED